MSEEHLMKLTLKHPIKIKRGEGADEKEQTLTELTLSRIKAKHLKYFPTDESSAKADDMVTLLGSLAGLTREEADEIDLDDILEMTGKLVPLLKGLPGTGETSSGE